MITVHISGNVLFTEVTEVITKEDFDKVTPVLENLVATYGKISWYFEMQHFKGWELGAFVQDVKESVKHATHFKKVAMVGDKGWEKMLTNVMKPFTSAEVRYFDLADKELARQWIVAS